MMSLKDIYKALVMFRVYIIIYRKTQKVGRKWSYRDENIAHKNRDNSNIIQKVLI